MKKGNLSAPSKTSFTLQALIEESLHQFKQKKKYKDIVLHLIDDLISPLEVRGEREKFKKILNLLFANAVDHVGASKIIVSLKQLLKTEHEVLLEFTVEDNGFTSAIEHKDEISLYKQGLEKILQLIEDFGGKTEVSSLDGIGNTVKFLVKFFWEASVDTLSEPASTNKLAGKRILVAEDNEINQKIIVHLLRKEKLYVDLANDGKEAVDFFEKNEYDLLLLDLQMPHMDGYQTANYIRKKLKSTIPIVAMTASAFSNEQTRCFEVGINQYLSKPFAPEDLFQRLRYFLLNEHQLKHQKPIEQNSGDLYSLQSLRETNEEDQIIEIIEMFLNQTPKLLAELKKERQAQDIPSLIKITAKLKGSLGSLQMQSMMQITDEIEFLIKIEDANKIPVAIEQLCSEYELISSLLEKELIDIKTQLSLK